MTAKTKAGLAVVALVLLAVAAFAFLSSGEQGVAVQTAVVGRTDLVQIVTASGEVTPLHYVNVGAEQMGRITEILVVEGQEVKRGQILARLEADQPRAEVDAQQAALGQLQSDLRAADAAIAAGQAGERAQEATLVRAQAELERAQLLFERAAELLEGGLISRDEYDRRRADRRAGEAMVAEAEANLQRLAVQQDELAARREAASRRIAQAEANLRRVRDVLRRYSYLSPIDGVVTNLPVKIGETVVPGIQNSPASLLMTIADMNVITAEVLVDETDVVNVRPGQTAQVSVDALPDEAFAARVAEIGATAILRSSGLAASQTQAATQEARDFEVTAAFVDPPPTLRPGMSCTARITTAERSNALAIPIQALTLRTVDGRDREGVFVVEEGKAVFRPVETGITGGADLEIVSGLSEGETIVIGGYEILRVLESETSVRPNSP